VQKEKKNQKKKRCSTSMQNHIAKMRFSISPQVPISQTPFG